MSTRPSPLILASSSRYRRVLLERLGIPFESIPPEVDEDAAKNLGYEPAFLARTLAEEKARVVARARPDAVVIGSDQVAAIDALVLDKPLTHEAAHAQLARLQGREHALHTAVTVIDPHGATTTDLVSVRLRMRALDDDAIDRYLRADEPLDCCGSYRIEARGIALFESIETSDFTAIEGLPMLTVVRRLRDARFAIP